MLRPRLGVTALCILPATALLAVLVAARTTRSAPDELDAIRQATAKYGDVSVALRDGYVRDPMNMCVTAPAEGQPAWVGGMGVHYFRPDLLGITGSRPRVTGTGTHTDFLQPGVLLYEPQANGTMRLVAVENLVFEKAWRAAGHSSPPAFDGREYFHMVDNPLTPADEAHGFAPHYEMHIWTEVSNPRGTFMEFNPRVDCRYHHPAPAGAAESQGKHRP